MKQSSTRPDKVTALCWAQSLREVAPDRPPSLGELDREKLNEAMARPVELGELLGAEPA
jgi:hypothetical protein